MLRTQLTGASMRGGIHVAYSVGPFMMKASGKTMRSGLTDAPLSYVSAPVNSSFMAGSSQNTVIRADAPPNKTNK